MNSGYIPEATIARLRYPSSQAVAATAGPRLLRDLEASLNTIFNPVADWAEAFRIVQHHEPGTHAVLLILSQDAVSGHVVTLTNFDGAPTLIEPQSWGPDYPQTVYATPAEATARYGTGALALGIVPRT